MKFHQNKYYKITNNDNIQKRFYITKSLLIHVYRLVSEERWILLLAATAMAFQSHSTTN